MVFPDETILAKVLVKTHYIVKVLKFYPETQTVDVVQETFEYVQHPAGSIVKRNEFGYEINVKLAVPDIIKNIPVQQLRWGQFSIQCAPQPGDTGYIEVMTDDSRSWVEDGGPAEPWLLTKMNKESCVFVPFVANKKNADKEYVSDENTLTIKSKNGSIVLTDDGEKSNIKITVDSVTVDSPEVNFTGKVTAEGLITSNEDVKSGNISLRNHIHNVPAGATVVAGTLTGAVTSNVKTEESEAKRGQ